MEPRSRLLTMTFLSATFLSCWLGLNALIAPTGGWNAGFSAAAALWALATAAIALPLVRRVERRWGVDPAGLGAGVSAGLLGAAVFIGGVLAVLPIL